MEVQISNQNIAQMIQKPGKDSPWLWLDPTTTKAKKKTHEDLIQELLSGNVNA